MKSISRIVAISVFIFFSFFLHAQTPCLGVSPETACFPTGTTPPNITVTGSNVPYSLFSTSDGLDGTDPDARYKAFWILGDGNFKYFVDDNKTTDLLSHTLTYTYEKSGTYRPTVLLSEKKSNTSPPQNPKRTIQTRNDQAIPAFSPRITDVEASMDIFNHERNRYPYPTAFVVSALEADKSNISQIYLFYNSMDATGSSTFSATAIQSYSSTEFPHYFGVAPSVAEQNTSALNSTPASVQYVNAFTTGTNSYLNYINVRMPASLAGATLPTNFNEFRFFPILNTTWNSGSLPKGRYLAVAVGPNPFSGTTLPSYVAKLRTDAAAQFPGIDATTLRITTSTSPSTLYIRGMATLEVNMVGAIDPNHLKVVKICPLGSGQYRVTLHMEVCNEGFVVQNGFKFFIKDARHNDPGGSQLFTEPVFEPHDPQPVLNIGESQPVGRLWVYNWGASLPALPEPPKSRTDPPPVHDNCRDIFFTTTTSWEGVQRLVAGRGLQLCVEFSPSIPQDCTHNDPIIPADQVTEAEGYRAEECEKEPSTTPQAPRPDNCDCCRPQYTIVIILQVTILILVLFIVWVLLKKVFPNALGRLFGGVKKD